MLVPEQLGQQHDVSRFTSGEPALDDWLRTEGIPAQKKGTGRVFVLIDSDDPSRRVLGYYVLSAHLLERGALTPRLGRGLPAQLPAVLLGKLAVEESRQGLGLGGQILAEAIARVVRLSEELGVRLLVVDALHEKAAAFYEHHGFTRIPTQESLRLVLWISAALLARTPPV